MKDDWLGIAYAVGYGGLFAFFIVMSLAFRRQRRRLLRGDLLRELGREVRRDPSFPMPFLKVDLRGLRAYFSMWPFGATSLRVISLLEIRVGCEGFLEATSRAGRRHPSMSTRITQVDVASDYVLMTSNVAWARELEAAGLTGILAELEARVRAPLRLQLTASRVTLEAERALDAPGVKAFLEAGERLLERLGLSPTAEGVEILDATLSAETGRCPVCGIRAEPSIACPACKTPHHADCRAYLGRCGIFGCAGRAV